VILRKYMETTISLTDLPYLQYHRMYEVLFFD